MKIETLTPETFQKQIFMLNFGKLINVTWLSKKWTKHNNDNVLIARLILYGSEYAWKLKMSYNNVQNQELEQTHGKNNIISLSICILIWFHGFQYLNATEITDNPDC